MNNIPPIKATTSPVGSAGRTPASDVGGEGTSPAPATGPVDRVDISEMGRVLSTLEPSGDFRIDKVLEIREAIAHGTYETDAKLQYTVSRLMEALRSPEA